MFNYRNPPTSPTPEEQYQNGYRIGNFQIDILPDDENIKIHTYWWGFRNSDFKKNSNHPVLEVLKKIYDNLKPEEFIRKPRFREFFNDKSDKTLIKIRSKKKYPKRTQFVAYLHLEIILKPHDFETGNLFFEYNNYGFPKNIPKSFKSNNTYSFLKQLDELLKKN